MMNNPPKAPLEFLSQQSGVTKMSSLAGAATSCIPKIIATVPIILFFFLSACDLTPKPERAISLANAGAFSASLSENYALIGTLQGYAELWKIKGKHGLIHRWKHTEEDSAVIATDISADEEFAITAEQNSIAWWDTEKGTLLAVWGLPGILNAKISPDGQFALIGLNDKAIYLALQYGKTLYAFSHEDKVLTTDLSASGRFALTGSGDQTAKLWDLDTGKLSHTWEHNNILSTVAISHNDKYVLTNSALNQTYLWKISNGKLHKEVGPKLITLSSATFSSDNKSFLIAHATQRIDLWKTRTGKLVNYWRAKQTEPTASRVLALHFSADNKKFQSFTSNGILKKWRK